MSEKVQVSREVAAAIESALIGRDKADLLKAHAVEGDWLVECAPLNNMDMVTLAQALIIGYEVEKTPEEQLSKKYMDAMVSGEIAKKFDVLKFTEQKNLAKGIKIALDTLGIKIKGINHKEEAK